MTTPNSDPAAGRPRPEHPELDQPQLDQPRPEQPQPEQPQPEQPQPDSSRPEPALTTPLSPPPPPDQPTATADAGRAVPGSAAGDPRSPGPATGDTASRGAAAGGSATTGAAAGDAARRPVRRSGPRTSPIVWGALILAFCGYVAQRTLGTDGLDTAWWITATVIGLGVLLLGVGAAVLIRGRR